MDEFNILEVQDFDRIIFLDRDGTINESPSNTWVTRVDELRYLNLNYELLRKMSELRFGFVIVTNQRGLSTGALDIEEYEKINLKLAAKFEFESVNLITILTCPHSYSCVDCRKPNPGMLTYALKKFHISSKACWMLGDQESDSQCAKAAGIPFKFVDNNEDEKGHGMTTNQALEEILLNG
jgi:D-glycero-D-manno-heptose 1,7-bisphosphate phosphatase